MCCTLNALTFSLKTQRTTDLLLGNLPCSDMHVLSTVEVKDVVLAEDNENVLEIRVIMKTKPKGVLHWVAEPLPGVDPLKVEVQLFDRLFNSENPVELEDWLSDLNGESKMVIPNAFAVPPLGKGVAVGDKFQFERLGYFVVDKDSTPEKLVFNRTVMLRDSYKSGK